MFGHFYGTPKDKVERSAERGKTVILEIDVQGARQIKAIFPDAAMIFILPPERKGPGGPSGHRGREAARRPQNDWAGQAMRSLLPGNITSIMVINEDLQQASERM